MWLSFIALLLSQLNFNLSVAFTFYNEDSAEK